MFLIFFTISYRRYERCEGGRFVSEWVSGRLILKDSKVKGNVDLNYSKLKLSFSSEDFSPNDGHTALS